MEKFNPASALFSILYKNNPQRGVNPSINDSATYFFNSAQEMTDSFEGKNQYYLYSRHWHPTNKALAEALARMEGTEAAWLTASGMAAITTTILHLCNAGDHIISSITVYGGTFAFFKNWLKKMNIDVSFVDITNLDEVKKAIRPNTKLIYTESITNPLLQVSDIPALKKIAQENNLKLIVDNTFSPLIISPFKLGADIVVYSLTKFVNGKNDLTAGAICGDKELIDEMIALKDGTAMLLGPVLDSYRASSILKNLYTLPIRMRQHSYNAMYIARKFEENGLDVRYPGLRNDKYHDIMLKIKNHGFGYGGMLALTLENKEIASKFMQKLFERNVGYLAVSLGYFRTLFSNSGSSTSSEVPKEYQEKMGLKEGLVRFSIGLDEDIEQVWQNIEKTLKELQII